MIDNKILPQITIKSAYKYLDEKIEVLNLFLFIEFCSVSFCVQRTRKNIDKFINNNKDCDFKIMSYLDVVYFFDNPNIVSDSIFQLKKKFGKKLKKISITKTMEKTLTCLSCYSCNFFIYLLECAYIDNPNNIITNGIYAEYQKTFWHENDIETLQNSLEYLEKYVIKNPNDLTEKISKFIDSKYNLKIFNSNKDEDKYNCLCDIDGCNFKCTFDDYNLFYCYECFLDENNNYYNLCNKHHTDDFIKQHIETEHKDTNNCRFIYWNEEFDNHKETLRIKKFINDINTL